MTERRGLEPCPWCGEKPEVTKHFKEDIWQLTHRCKVVGPITIDWTSDEGKLTQRWNTRTPATGYVMVPMEDLERLLLLYIMVEEFEPSLIDSQDRQAKDRLESIVDDAMLAAAKGE